jgi:hypothetical protein
LKLLQDAKENLSQEFENLANRIFDDKQAKFSAQSKEALEVSLSPLRRDIGDFRKQVETVYDKENADRNKLVGHITELQKQTMQISADAVSLANALRGDNKAQGNWGEFVLEKLLEDSGLSKGREYDTQVALKDEDGKRRNPDVIIHLPEGRDIIIDAKVSIVLSHNPIKATYKNDNKIKAVSFRLPSFEPNITKITVTPSQDNGGICNNISTSFSNLNPVTSRLFKNKVGASSILPKARVISLKVKNPRSASFNNHLIKIDNSLLNGMIHDLG